MTNQLEINEILKGLPQVRGVDSVKLLTVKIKEAYLEWQKWFNKGKEPFCGPSRTFYYFLLIFNPKQRDRYIEHCAKILVSMQEISQKKVDSFYDLKIAVKEVLDDSLKKQQAFGFGKPEQFWKCLGALVEPKYKLIIERLLIREDEYRDDIEKQETEEDLPPSVINLDAENEMVEMINEKIKWDSLDELTQEVLHRYEAGEPEKKIAGETGLKRWKVRKIIEDNEPEKNELNE